MKERQKRAQHVWLIGLGVNGALAMVKLVAGVVGNSFALIADAVESLGDIFSSFIVVAGLVIGSRPPDSNHPYGHGKAEPLASLAVAVMLLAAAAGIAWHAVAEMKVPHEAPAPYTLVVLIVVVVAKEMMFRFASHTGKEIDHPVVEVDAWHHRADALTSLAAAVGISLTLIGGPSWIHADEWAALLACIVIGISGGHFAVKAIGDLMDTAPHDGETEKVIRASFLVEGALAVEKVFVRKMGDAYYVDMHLEVNPSSSIREAHDVAHKVKASIMRHCPKVAGVLVHVEPYDEARSGRAGRKTRPGISNHDELSV